MGRQLRINIPNLTYHILNRGNNKQIIFHDNSDYEYYLRLIKRYKDKYNLNLYHLSLMPNHVHFQLLFTKEGDLSKFMHRLTVAHTWYYNKKYETVGHVWQGRFKNPVVDTDEYFLRCGLYIELNAVRAGLVEKPEDWRWSSFNFYAFGKGEPLIEKIIDIDPFYLAMAESLKSRQELYRARIGEVMQEEFLKKVKVQFDKGIYGSEEFVEQMSKKLGVTWNKKKGRPRKREPEIGT